MKVIGIIAEYNPFHLGHLYQINKIKEMYPDSIIIAIVSSCFTERGDISVINKWNKTKICLDNNIDLVVELPFKYASQAADIFASGALEILNHLKIDTLVFGSESNDIELLKRLSKIQLFDKNYDNLVKKYLDMGINYPTALSKALSDISKDDFINNPNDLLGLSYVKEIIKNNYNIEPVCIQRTNDYHNNILYDDGDSNIINASLIRQLLLDNKDISNYIPNYDRNFIYDAKKEMFFDFFKYFVLANRDNLKNIVSVDEGIENRLLKYINVVDSFKGLTECIKTKRYTYNKINRMYIHILTNFTKDENNALNIDYIRLLGFNNIGKKYLNKIKKDISVKLVTNYKKNISKLFDLEFRVSSIYGMVIDNNLIDMEYKNKPIMK